jgi:6-phosphogluconolactonase/glucosamine-6-phosphate isomerase/deaminase
MKTPAPKFTFAPAGFIPFRDTAAIARVRAIKRDDITHHRNPDFRITVIPDADLEFLWITDMFFRIKTAMDAGQPYVMIMPNPWPGYAKLAQMLNRARVDCRTLHTFNMDEYADEQGRIAPESWEFGFGHAFKKYFWSQLDRKFRPAEKQIHCFSDKNLKDYGRMLADLGNADICYSGPGWTGHLAFIEPDAPEFAGSLEEWKKMGPRVCTLSPFTIAQNSLHGCFGMSGDLCAVPPKAATIGPAEVIGAKHRIQMHGITVDGSFASWQRLTTRLVLHGPVTKFVPESLLQTLRTDVWVTEALAANIEPRWDKGY